MKKIIAITLLLVMGLSLLAGCGSDPVADDFTKYMNTDMVDVNANYDKIKEESGKWENYTKDEEVINSANNVILPLINDSLDKLSKINPETDEVKSIKDKYVKVMEAYKEGYTKTVEYCNTGDETAMNTGKAKLEEGIKLLDEYNKALESLAEEKGMTIEY